MVTWLIGMSGSGKTTLGKYLYEKLRPGHKNLVFLDGDIIRKIMGNDLGHTIEDRKRNAHRITRLCKFLDSQGIDVICAVLSIFPESHEWNRANIKDYYEVYIEVPFDTLVQRDAKGYYKKALKGELSNVVGIDIKFPPPKNPDMVIKNTGSIEELNRSGDKLLNIIKERLLCNIC